jgi:hypothetical protein
LIIWLGGINLSQNSIVVANGTGATVRAAINDAIESIATDFYGVTDPSTIAGISSKIIPGFTWTKSDTNIVYKRNAANNGWFKFLDLTTENILTTLNQPYIQVVEEYTTGTNGLTNAAGTWNIRHLNTLKEDTGSIATLNAGAFSVTVPAGIYYCKAAGAARNCSGHALRLRDITNSITLTSGINAYIPGGDGVVSQAVMGGRFTLALEADLQLQHYTYAQWTNAFGIAIGAPTEIYAMLELWKLD